MWEREGGREGGREREEGERERERERREGEERIILWHNYAYLQTYRLGPFS